MSTAAMRAPLLVGVVLMAAALAGLWAAPQYESAALMGLVLALALVLVLLRPIVGLCLAAFAIPLENLVVVGGITWVRALVGLVLVAWLLQVAVQRRSLNWVLSGPVVKPTFLFIVFGFASLLWAQHYPTATRDVVMLASLFAFTLLVIGVVDSWQRAEWLVRSMVLGGLVAAGITIFQFFVLGAKRAGEGVSGGVNDTGATMVLLIPIAFYLFVSDKDRTWRLVGLAFIGAAVLTVALTVSRLSMLALPLVLLALAWEMLRSRRAGPGPLLAFASAIALVAFFVVPWDRVLERGSTIVGVAEGFADGDPRTGENRIQHWQGAIEMFKDHPALGVGLGNFGFQFLDYQFRVPDENGRIYVNLRSPHSTFLGLLAELGIVGTGLWLLMLASVIATVARSLNRSSRSGWWSSQVLSRMILYTLLAYGLYSLFSITHNHKLFWLLLGMAVALDYLTRTHTHPSVSDSSQALMSSASGRA